jgi:hypothetical protein
LAYTPKPGMDPEKIHRALAAINRENGNQGATAEAVAERSGIALPKVRREIDWALNGGNDGHDVMETVRGEKKYRHTGHYHPYPPR